MTNHINKWQWTSAIRERKRATARWGYPHDVPNVRAEGRVIGFSLEPMVLLETDDGDQLWWAAELVRVNEDEAGA